MHRLIFVPVTMAVAGDIVMVAAVTPVRPGCPVAHAAPAAAPTSIHRQGRCKDNEGAQEKCPHALIILFRLCCFVEV